MKRSNICALKIPGREERHNGAETMSEEIITRDFMKVMRTLSYGLKKHHEPQAG